MRNYIFYCLFFYTVVSFSQEAMNKDMLYEYHFYSGVSGGYGSTTWQGLVPSMENKNMALSISTPTSVQEGGGVWGAFLGYELTPYFALEASYMKYPDAHITFDKDSLFSFNNDGRTLLHTKTDTGSIMGKVMLFIPKTMVRLYSGAGVAGVERHDEINSNWRLSPTFGVGLNYNFTPRIMGEIGSNYTAGYGESELNPAKDFVPFLYSVFLRLGLRF